VCRNHEALGVRMFNTHLYPSMVPEDAKVIYVMRRGKDVVYSFYQHLSHQIIDGKVDFEGSFEEFVQGWVEGGMPFGKWTDHLKVWREEARPGVLYLVYEEMKADLGRAVHQVAEFLELGLSYDDVEALVTRFTIDAMKADRKMFEPVSVQWKALHNAHTYCCNMTKRNPYTLAGRLSVCEERGGGRFSTGL